MLTEPTLLEALQALWQAAPPAVGPTCRPPTLPTAEPSSGPPTVAEGMAGLPAVGDQADADLEPFDWFALIGEAERRYLLSRHRHHERCGFCGGFFKHNAQCVALCDEWAVKMPFGKYKGQRVADVSRDYLRWLRASGKELDGDLRREIERVLEIGGRKP